ncbi:MAG TPA: ATP synthase F1 subunit epsilon [Bacteroidales bacterium]|nr:ATP synthase F1 subunit epsilon [Bacteroidales bacterium]HSA44454.1 ATP synthase F1 subunit epsilon [Bacteroidales bacterium]
MHLDIITPDSSIFTGEVSLVQLPGKDGSFEILNQHAPLIAVLKHGEIRILDPQKHEKIFTVKGGVVEVSNNRILVLAE